MKPEPPKCKRGKVPMYIKAELVKSANMSASYSEESAKSGDHPVKSANMSARCSEESAKNGDQQVKSANMSGDQQCEGQNQRQGTTDLVTTDVNPEYFHDFLPFFPNFYRTSIQQSNNYANQEQLTSNNRGETQEMDSVLGQTEAIKRVPANNFSHIDQTNNHQTTATTPEEALSSSNLAVELEPRAGKLRF